MQKSELNINRFTLIKPTEGRLYNFEKEQK